MKNQDFFKISLPKWPAMVVTGEPVSREQALEVIMRTDSYWCYPSTNYRDIDDEIMLELDLALIPEMKNFEDSDEYFEASRVWKENLQAFRDSIGYVDDLEFLHNSWVGSSYIGGPHGWISPDGTISQTDKNIGKWPDVENVYNEWKLIAKEFPFLKLNATLFNGESCDENPEPLVTFKVKDGRVRMVDPSKVDVVYPTQMDFHAAAARLFGNGPTRGYTSEHHWSPQEIKDIVNFIKSERGVYEDKYLTR